MCGAHRATAPTTNSSRSDAGAQCHHNATSPPSTTDCWKTRDGDGTLTHGAPSAETSEREKCQHAPIGRRAARREVRRVSRPGAGLRRLFAGARLYSTSTFRQDIPENAGRPAAGSSPIGLSARPSDRQRTSRAGRSRAPSGPRRAPLSRHVARDRCEATLQPIDGLSRVRPARDEAADADEAVALRLEGEGGEGVLEGAEAAVDVADDEVPSVLVAGERPAMRDAGHRLGCGFSHDRHVGTYSSRIRTTQRSACRSTSTARREHAVLILGAIPDSFSAPAAFA